MTTQEQYNILRQPIRRLNIKIDLLNKNDIVVGSFEGIAVEGGLNFSGESTYRRSGNLTMVFDKKYNLLPAPDSKIWFNNRIGIHIGIKNYLDEIVWFNMGRFAIDEVDLNFNSAEKTISCQLKDYMAFLDGTLSGILSHEIKLLPDEVPISEAIKSSLIGLGRVSVEDIRIDGSPVLVPYLIERYPGTSTVYELVMELVRLYMSYDFYCNEDGYYTVEKIRNKKGDPVVEVFDGTDKDFTLTSTPKIDFKNVRNSIWIWGLQLEDGTKVKWNYRNRWSRENYSDLDSLTDREMGDICFIKQENKSYVWYNNAWTLLDFNVVSQFNMENIGEKVYSVSDNKIFNEAQAKIRAEYELEKRSNLAETISFSCIPLYHLQINNKIHINIDGDIVGDYLIDTISVPMDISNPMNITCHRIYY